MLAIELSASIFCAREMRGMLSTASAVAPFCASCWRRPGFCAGQRKHTSVWPAWSSSTSFVPVAECTSGARTFRITSLDDQIDPASLTMVAPACW
jgi:hypothetical protein